MSNTQETPNLRIVSGTNPVAVIRAYAKAKTGDQGALQWLLDQHRAGNNAATKAIQDLDRTMPNPASVA